MPIQRAKPRFSEVKNVTNITADELNIGQIGGRRNIIINGAMQVAQRGTSFTSQTADHFIVDRFKLGATSLGTWTTSQSTDAPTGFSYSAKIECTTADASPASTDTLYFYTRFEGQDLQHLKFGTSDAESITISFYVKCSKTGVFTVNWRNQDAGRSIGSDVTINSADTWEFKTITFAGDTSGAFTNDNGWSANLEFMLNGGSNYTSGSTLTSYASHSNTNGTRSGGTTLALGANTGETIQFTGIQLEVGEVATPFEHRSYGEELQLCKRYFQYWGRSSSSSGDNSICAWGMYYSNTLTQHFFPMQVEMRANPSVSTATTTYGDFDVFGRGYSDQPSTAPSFFRISNKMFRAQFSTTSRSGAYSAWLEVSDATDNSQGVEADAEL